MKICYVLPHFYPHVGGAEQAFLDLIEELVKKEDVEVRVITSASGGVKGNQKYKGIDIYYYDWKMLFGHPIVKKKDIKQHIEWADLVHAAVYSPVRSTCKLARKLKKPVIVTAHEVLGKRWFIVEKNKIKALIFYIYENYVIKAKCNYFHTPSCATKADLEKYNKKANIENIYWIVDENMPKVNVDKEKFKEYFNLRDKDKVFLNYGRPGKTKGVFVYLDAIEKTIKSLKPKEMRNIKFCFIMAKDPAPEREKFLKQVKEHKLSKYVIVKESVDRADLQNYVMCADYIVVPSITEGFGLTAIESCNMGKKLIHSSGGSLPEVTFGEVIQFENKNSDDLSDKLSKVIKKEIKFEKKERKDFSKENITRQVMNLYNKLLNNEEVVEKKKENKENKENKEKKRT